MSHSVLIIQMDEDSYQTQEDHMSQTKMQVSLDDGNFTTSDTPISDEDAQLRWMLSMVFSVTISVLVFYLVIALTFYCFRKRILLRGRTENNGSALLQVMNLICGISVLIYFLIQLPMFVQQQNPFCAVKQRITTVAGILTYGSVYFALWFRVYSIFYSDPFIKKQSSKLVRIISKVTVVLLLLMLLVNSTVFLTAPDYVTSPFGCLKYQSRNGNAFKWGMLASSVVCFQVTLLFLFVHPLYLHRRKSLSNGFDSRAVMPVIRRAFITAAVCMVSDTANSVYAIANNETLGYVRHTVYGANLVVNFVALLLSYNDWREKVCPCFAVKRRLQRYDPRSQTLSARISSIS